MDGSKRNPRLLRAYSNLQIKGTREDERIIIGLATTPETDRMGDIVEPDGAEFKLPIPLLWQHDAKQPIGTVSKAEVTPEGIRITAQISKIDAAGALKARVDDAWESIKAGLVRGLSIGFRALQSERIDGGFRFTRWEWLELSAVTIPANAASGIHSLKSAFAMSALAANDPSFKGRAFSKEKIKANFDSAWLRLVDERKESLRLGQFDKWSEHPAMLKFAILSTMESILQEMVLNSLYIEKMLGAIDARLTQLEAKPDLKYCGVFNDQDAPYQVGEFVTYKGSLWHCWQPTTDLPGTSDAWQMAVKRGRDAS